MNIYKHKKTGVLYMLFVVKPLMFLGEWTEAVPLHGGKTKKHIKQSDYVLVGEK